MKYTKFGRTGLDVSRLCLGCMSYGDPARGPHAWTLGDADSRPFLRRALDLGFNFFDTANVYSDGSSEEIVGRALLDFTGRGSVVIATKVHGRMRKGPNGAGLSRKAILAEIDASLQRLGHHACGRRGWQAEAHVTAQEHRPIGSRLRRKPHDRRDDQPDK